jgi:predicted O-methyltransferase YrrM
MLFPAFLQVNDDWILRRLEKWGRREGMPFLGPQKAVILQQLVQQQQPQLAVEVGSMAGYSAIVIAQVIGGGERGERGPGHRVGD